MLVTRHAESILNATPTGVIQDSLLIVNGAQVWTVVLDTSGVLLTGAVVMAVKRKKSL